MKIGKHNSEDTMVKGNIKAVFFDVDNTLFDQITAWKEGVRLLKEKHPDVFDGVKTEDAIDTFFRLEDRIISRFQQGEPIETLRIARGKEFLRMLNLDENHAEKITESFMHLHPRIDAPIDGAKKVVETLSKKLTLGVITNGDKVTQSEKLETIGVKDRFESLIFSEEVGIRKPDPGIFTHAAKEVGLDPGNCLYVGDSYKADIQGGEKGGMKTCWFRSREQRNPLQDATPDFEIRSLKELLDLV